MSDLHFEKISKQLFGGQTPSGGNEEHEASRNRAQVTAEVGPVVEMVRRGQIICVFWGQDFLVTDYGLKDREESRMMPRILARM